jgi:hypothetical protein
MARTPGPARKPLVALVCVVAHLAFVAVAAAPAAAQQARQSPLAIDSVASADFTFDENGNEARGIFLDSLVTADIGRGIQGMFRPQVQRLANSGEWNRQVWIAEVRYERAGTVGLRIEGGYIPSPIGLANLTLRPHLNPTIAQPASLFTSIPSPEFRGPRINLLSGLYPLGAQATVSMRHWDARAAIMDNSPLRLRRVFSAENPPRFTNIVIGGGVTPFVGFRVGGSVAQGGWLRAGESPTVTADRSARVVTLETELAFRHTSLAGEWTHDTVETSIGDRTVAGWYVQGMQTLTPRWFVAGRVEAMRTTLPVGLVQEQRFKSTEQTLGFRLTREITLRVSHRMREPFGVTTYDHFGAVSVVWFRRWM